MPYLLILLFQQDTIVINLQEHNRFESLPEYFPKLEIQLIFFQVAAIVLGPEMYSPYVSPQTKQKCLSLSWYLPKLEFKSFKIHLFHVIVFLDRYCF
jgi:hypothetical protein